jgi:hypothetical protein
MRRPFSAVVVLVALAATTAGCRDNGDAAGDPALIEMLRLRCDGNQATQVGAGAVLLGPKGVAVEVENTADAPLRLAGSGGPDIKPGDRAVLFAPLAPGMVEAGCSDGTPALVEVVDPADRWRAPAAALTCAAVVTQATAAAAATAETAEEAARRVLRAGPEEFVVNLDGEVFGIWYRGGITALVEPVALPDSEGWQAGTVRRCQPS